MNKIKAFFGQRTYFLTLACAILAVLSTYQFDRDAREYAESHPAAESKPTVKIGVSLPLSGNIGYMGQALKGALDIALDDLNKRTLKNNYEFILENNGYDAKQIAAVNAKFLYQDKVAAILTFASLTGNLTTLAVKDKGVIHINACASDKNIADGKYSFLHTTLPDQEAEALINNIKGRFENVAVVNVKEVSTEASEEEIIKKLKEDNINFKVYSVNPGEKDMRMMIDKMIADKPDLYVILLYSPTIEIFVRQLKEKGVETPLTSTHYFSNTKEPELLEGAVFVDYPQVKGETRRRIEDRNKHVSNFMMCTGNIYDAVMMLVDSFETTDTSELAAEYLQKLGSYDGVMGHAISKEPGIFQVSPVSHWIKNGKVVAE